MPPRLSPALEHELFAVALEFREAQPWRRIVNTQYLLVAEPSGGRRALVVLGNGGEQFGLQSYAASCAMRWLVMVEELPRMILACPTVVFELLEGHELELTAKAELDGADLERLARQGYRPPARTRHAWPRFRTFRQYRFPWHVDEAGARVLVGDLRRALRWVALAPHRAFVFEAK